MLLLIHLIQLIYAESHPPFAGKETEAQRLKLAQPVGCETRENKKTAERKVERPRPLNFKCPLRLDRASRTAELKTTDGRARWLTPVIPALWEAKVSGSRGQEIETILVNMVKPRLY